MLERSKVAYHDTHSNGDHFLVAYDHASGSPGRYTVLVWRVGRTARIIGRELKLKHARRIVAAYPKKPLE